MAFVDWLGWDLEGRNWCSDSSISPCYPGFHSEKGSSSNAGWTTCWAMGFDASGLRLCGFDWPVTYIHGGERRKAGGERRWIASAESRLPWSWRQVCKVFLPSSPALVQRRIAAAGLDWRVVNAGVSGDTSAGAKARLDWVFRQKPRLLFLCIGSNDGLRGIPVAETERNLRAILDRARQEKVRVVLAGAMLPENYGKDYRQAFQSLFPRLAKAYRLPFLPFLLEGVALRPDLNQDDGIHPNAKGAAKVAENVWRVIEPELGANRSPRP